MTVNPDFSFIQQVELPDPPAQGIFDPTIASDAELKRYGIPNRPPVSDRAYDLWRYIASGKRLNNITSLLSQEFATGYNRLLSRGHYETSRNWCGGVASAPYSSKPFRTIFATWTAPLIRATTRAPNTQERSSIWIGFEGHKRQSKTLPQIGITAIRNPGGNSHYVAWRQWWLDLPAGQDQTKPIIYKGFDIKEHDRIICSLDIWSQTEVIFNMCRIRQNSVACTKPIKMVVPSHFGVSGIEAECIVERPMRVNSTVRYPLCAIENVSFECLVMHSFGSDSNDFLGARLVRMIHEVQNPNNIRSLATPRRLNKTSNIVQVEIS